MYLKVFIQAAEDPLVVLKSKATQTKLVPEYPVKPTVPQTHSTSLIHNTPHPDPATHSYSHPKTTVTITSPRQTMHTHITATNPPQLHTHHKHMHTLTTTIQAAPPTLQSPNPETPVLLQWRAGETSALSSPTSASNEQIHCALLWT